MPFNRQVSVDFSFQALKARQREIRDGFPESLGFRTHRALSWLNRAEQAEDADGKFIFLWIAFNAAYANEIPDRASFAERRLFRSSADIFFNRLCNYWSPDGYNSCE
jgi:hypothetical protein